MTDREIVDVRGEEDSDSTKEIHREDHEEVEPVASFSEDLAGFAAAAGKAVLVLGVGLGVAVITMTPTMGASHSAKIQWNERQQQVAEILETAGHGEVKTE